MQIFRFWLPLRFRGCMLEASGIVHYSLKGTGRQDWNQPNLSRYGTLQCVSSLHILCMSWFELTFIRPSISTKELYKLKILVVKWIFLTVLGVHEKIIFIIRDPLKTYRRPIRDLLKTYQRPIRDPLETSTCFIGDLHAWTETHWRSRHAPSET